MPETFENYFAELLKLDAVKNQMLVEQYIQSVLDRLALPHITEEGMKTADFFKDLVDYANALAKQKDCGIEIELFLAGGVVRSLLGYMYKFVHERKEIAEQYTKPLSEVIKTTAAEASKISGPLPPEQAHLVPDLEGDALAREQAARKKALLTGTEFHLKQAALAEKEKLASPFVLGVGSDLDCFYQVKPTEGGGQAALTEEQKQAGKEIAAKLEYYINRTAKQAGLLEVDSAIKNSILPSADVAEINENEQRALEGGGSLMDALAFRLENDTEKRKYENQLRLPEEHQAILQDFLAGVYEYIAPKVGPGTKAIRGLRALVEIPFLDIKDADVIIAELKFIIEDIASGKGLKDDARIQFEKLVRNAQFQLAGNRPYREAPDSPMGLALKIANALYEKKEGNLTDKVRFLLPIFLQRMPLDNRSDEEIESQEKTENYADLKTHLMSREKFIAEHTDNGKLYHGTGAEAGISVLRGGFVLSTDKQGTATYGPGVYTTPFYSEAAGYSAEGMVLPLNIATENLKIINWDTVPNELRGNLKQEAKEAGYEHVFDMLKARGKYGIDIIVADYVLIQNQAAIDLELSLEAMLDWVVSSAPGKIKKIDELEKYLNTMMQYEYYYELFESIGVDVSQKLSPQAYYKKKIKELIDNGVDLNLLSETIDPGEIKRFDDLMQYVYPIMKYKHYYTLFTSSGIDVSQKLSPQAYYKKKIKELVDSDVDLNWQDASYERRTILIATVIAKDIELVKTLLINGANPNLYDGNGKTALHYALKNKDKDAVDLLYNEKTDLLFPLKDYLKNYKDYLKNYDTNPNSTDDIDFIVKLIKNYLKVCEKLKIMGKTVRDELSHEDLYQQYLIPEVLALEGETMLDYAIQTKNKEIVSLLYKEDSDISYTLKKYLENPDLNKDFHIVNINYLIENCVKSRDNLAEMGFDVQNQPSQEALYQQYLVPAVRGLNKEQAHSSLKYADSPSVIAVIVKEHGPTNSAFMRSIYRGDMGSFDLMLDKIDDVNFTESKGNYQTRFSFKSSTPLLEAIKSGRNEMARRLIEKGADPNKNFLKDIPSALLYAIKHGTPDIAMLLLEHGAKLDAVDNKGNNALMLASAKGHVELARKLLSMAIDTEKTNNAGKTAFELATDPEIKKLLQTKENQASMAGMSKYAETQGVFKGPKTPAEEKEPESLLTPKQDDSMNHKG